MEMWLARYAFQNCLPVLRLLPVPIESHRRLWTEGRYKWDGRRQQGINHLRYQGTRRNMMCPSQAVDVARQAFTPEGFRRLRSQMVEESPRRNSNAPWSTDSDGSIGGPHLGHPTASSGKVSCLVASPMASRWGARFPGRGDLRGFCSTAASGAFFDPGPLSPRRVRSRSSAPSDSVNSASLSNAFCNAALTRLSGMAALRKWVRVTVLASSSNASVRARLRWSFSNPIQPMLRAYKNSHCSTRRGSSGTGNCRCKAHTILRNTWASSAFVAS